MRKHNVVYEVREIRDLKEMLATSAEMFCERPVFLKKERPGGQYLPITYGAFKKDVDFLGTALLELGLKGKKIAVIGETRYEWILTYLAVVNGVGVIVPLDRELPENEIENLLSEAEASALVYSGKVENVIKKAAENLETLEYLVCMDAEQDGAGVISFRRLLKYGEKLLSEGKDNYTAAEIDPDAMSVLLFTSGTTGLAKGVMLSHKNICNNVMEMSRYIKINPEDIVLSVLPVHHTYECTCGIMTPVFNGACVAFCEGLKHIAQNMKESKATIMLGVPLIFESMYNRMWRKAEKEGKAKKLRKAVLFNKTLQIINLDASKKLFKSIHDALGGSIRLFISGAAAIDPEIVENFNYMGIMMFQGYGLTESSPIVCVNKDSWYKHASVGIPFKGTQVQIANPDENGIGEIITKSDSVMLGYYKNKEETDKVLKDGWLYTGDYGYMDKDGFIYIAGRKKNVIVTKNGKNIYPEEVEFYLNKSDFIKECMVYGQEDKNSFETLVCAEIVPDFDYLKEKGLNLTHDEMNLLIQKIVDDTNEKMPLYKRIRRFNIRKEELEKTTTKKIKRYSVK